MLYNSSNPIINHSNPSLEDIEFKEDRKRNYLLSLMLMQYQMQLREEKPIIYCDAKKIRFLKEYQK